MSVIVKMEMPEGCHDCKLRNMLGNCPIAQFDEANDEKYWTLKECFERPPWCPIICELPEKHGRLVDARVAYDKIAEQESGYYMDMDGVDMGLDETPTLVPAEGSET